MKILPLGERLDHDYMRSSVSGIFRGKVFEDPERDGYEIRIGSEFAYGRSWLVLRDGPHFLEKAWASRGKREMRKAHL